MRMKSKNKRKIFVNTKNIPKCPWCNAEMTLILPPKKDQTWKPFWGCSKYPICKGTRIIDDQGNPTHILVGYEYSRYTKGVR